MVRSCRCTGGTSAACGIQRVHPTHTALDAGGISRRPACGGDFREPPSSTAFNLRPDPFKEHFYGRAGSLQQVDSIRVKVQKGFFSAARLAGS